MRIKKLWPFLISILVVVLLSLFIFGPFFHRESTVNYAAQLEDFKTRGVPDFNLVAYDTKTFGPGGVPKSLKSFEGQLIFINFWATWCAPCLKEFPSLVELARQYKGGKIAIVAISVDKNISEIKPFLGAKGIPPENLTILLDPEGKTAAEYGTLKIPETYIVDRDGKLIRKVIDEQNWISRDFLTFLQGLLLQHQNQKGGA